jgi:hypothetical protein
VYGQENKIVYPQVSIGPLPEQFDSPDFFPYFDQDYSGSVKLRPEEIEIELRLGNLSATDDWNGEIRLLNGADLTESLDIDIIDGDYNYLPENFGAYEVNILPGGSSVYKISSGEFQRGVLVIEANASSIADLTTSFLFKPRIQGGKVSDLVAVQPATAPANSFRAMVCGTDEGDYPFANLESGIAVVPASALSGTSGATTELTLKVFIDDGEPYEGTITLEDEQKTVMLRQVIDNLPDSFKTGQLSLVADEPVYASMIGIGSRPGFLTTQYASVPATPFVSDSKPAEGVGYLQYRDLLMSFTEEFWLIWGDFESGATLDGTFWQPIIPPEKEDFYLVGDLGTRGWGTVYLGKRYPKKSSVVLVKDAYGDYCAEDGVAGCSENEKLSCNQHLRLANGGKSPALCPPVDYTPVWIDSGTGVSDNFSVFWPIAPVGYHCLGAIGSPHHPNANFPYPLTPKPEFKDKRDRYRCVRNDLLTVAAERPEFECGDLNGDGVINSHDCWTSDIWNTSGSGDCYFIPHGPFTMVWICSGGADQWFRASEIIPSAPSPGEYALAPGTFVVNSEHTTMQYISGQTNLVTVPQPMSFRLELDQVLNDDPAPLPDLLDGPYPPSPFSISGDASTVTLPWFAVKDPDMQPIMQAIESPVYTMKRVTHYKLVEWAYNRTDLPQSVMWQFSWGTYGETSTKMEHQVGISFGMEFGSEAIMVNAKFEFSYQFTHSTTDTSGWTETKVFTLPVQIPAGTAVAAYQLESVFTLLRKDGTQVSVNVPYSLDRIIFDQYPQAADSEGKNGGRIILEGMLSRTD